MNVFLLVLACGVDRDNDGVSGLLGDCQDDNPAVHPGAEELCNGVDDDCDGTVDGHDATGSGWLDADGDGYGSEWLCEPSLDLVAAGGDCNDGDPLVSPGAAEVCNAVDDDCDGVVDDGTPLMTWWPDTDGDGYGVFLGDWVQACEQPVGYAGNDADCDDGEHDINPGNWWYPDADGDGFGDTESGVQTCHPEPGYVEDGTDCNDDPDAGGFAINADATEICDDADVDEDCDGVADDGDQKATGSLPGTATQMMTDSGPAMTRCSNATRLKATWTTTQTATIQQVRSPRDAVSCRWTSGTAEQPAPSRPTASWSAGTGGRPNGHYRRSRWTGSDSTNRGAASS